LKKNKNLLLLNLENKENHFNFKLWVLIIQGIRNGQQAIRWVKIGLKRVFLCFFFVVSIRFLFIKTRVLKRIESELNAKEAN